MPKTEAVAPIAMANVSVAAIVKAGLLPQPAKDIPKLAHVHTLRARRLSRETLVERVALR